MIVLFANPLSCAQLVVVQLGFVGRQNVVAQQIPNWIFHCGHRENFSVGG
jgi:hypothetical protein